MVDEMRLIRAEIAKIGAAFDPEINERTRALYAPLVDTNSEEFLLRSDVPYGDHVRQKMDVFGAGGSDRRPILLFVPGGGFVGGDKNLDRRFYGNIGRWFARRGMLVFLMNYRLAPDFGWPAGGQDVRDAVKWIRDHAGKWGGDPDDFTLFAQSAGAAHAASYIFHPAVRRDTIQVSRAVLSSGVYDLAVRPIPPNYMLYYGTDESRYSQYGVLQHAGNTDIPILLTYSEFDPPFLAIPTFRLAEALAKARGKSPRLQQLAGHNHVSNVLSFGSGDDLYGNEILGFAGIINLTENQGTTSSPCAKAAAIAEAPVISDVSA